MKFVLVDHLRRQRALQAVAEAPEGYVVTITPKKRTLGQAALFHDLCEQLGAELGYTPAEMKDVIKMEVFGPVERKIGGRKLIELKSTADMDTKELSLLINALHIRAGECGVTLYTNV